MRCISMQVVQRTVYNDCTAILVIIDVRFIRIIRVVKYNKTILSALFTRRMEATLNRSSHGGP